MRALSLSLAVVTLVFPSVLVASDPARWDNSMDRGNRYTALPYQDGRARTFYPTPTPVPTVSRIMPPVRPFPTPRLTPGLPPKFPVPVFPTPTATPGIPPTLPPKSANPYGFKPPTGPASNAFVFWYNMYTGQTWHAPTGGWVPPDENWVTGVSPNIVSRSRNPYNFKFYSYLGQSQTSTRKPVLWINTKTYEGWWAPDSSYTPTNNLWVRQDKVSTRPTTVNFGFRSKSLGDPGGPRLVTMVFQSFYNVVTGQVVTFSHGGMQPPNIEWRVGEGPGVLWPRNPYGFREAPQMYSPGFPSNPGIRPPVTQTPTYWHNMVTEEGWWAPSRGWEPPTGDWSRNVRPGSRTGRTNPFGFNPPSGSKVTMVISPWINLYTGQMWTFSHGGHTPPNSQWIRGSEWPKDNFTPLNPLPPTRERR